MPDGLYEQDSLAWAEQQSGLLRRLAAGERVNEAVDWPHVIEEIHDVGLSELRACKSLLRQCLSHLLKLHAWPNSQSTAGWTEEAYNFAADARDAFSPSMRQRIALSALYAEAVRRVERAVDASGVPQPMPNDCPFNLDDLLAGDVPALLGKLPLG